MTLTERVSRLHKAFRSEPEAVILSVVCFWSGLVSLLGLVPLSVEVSLSKLMQILWSISLVVGGLLRTSGLMRRRPRLDGLGCLLLGWASLTFGLAITTINIRGLVGALLIAAFGYGCLARWWQYYKLGRAQGPHDS